MLVIVVLLASAQRVAAQEEQEQSQQPQQLQSDPQEAQPTAPSQPVKLQLTPDEQDLLDRGYISGGQHVAGGVAALFVGFGVGHAIQGRWTNVGWIMTVGEAASLSTSVAAGYWTLAACFSNQATQCDTAGALVVMGALSLIGFRLAGTIDAFVSPPRHNRRLHDLQLRLGSPSDGNGATAGLTLRF